MYHPGRVPTDSAVTCSSAEPFRTFIETELAKRRNAVAIYQDLVEHHRPLLADSVFPLALARSGSRHRSLCTRQSWRRDVDLKESGLAAESRADEDSRLKDEAAMKTETLLSLAIAREVHTPRVCEPLGMRYEEVPT